MGFLINRKCHVSILLPCTTPPLPFSRILFLRLSRSFSPKSNPRCLTLAKHRVWRHCALPIEKPQCRYFRPSWFTLRRTRYLELISWGLGSWTVPPPPSDQHTCSKTHQDLSSLTKSPRDARKDPTSIHPCLTLLPHRCVDAPPRRLIYLLLHPRMAMTRPLTPNAQSFLGRCRVARGVHAATPLGAHSF